MRTLICSLLLVICANAAYGFEGVPVLLWGSKSSGKVYYPPAINSIASESILSENIVKSQYTVVFVGDKLSPEALNECGEKKCFPYLENVEQKSYFANVENPIGLLATAGNGEKIEWVTAGAELLPEAGKITFVTLTPGDFHAQDAEIEKVVKQLEGKSNSQTTVFVYTAQHNDVAQDTMVGRRIKRETAPKQDEVEQEPLIFFRDNETYIISYTTIGYLPGNTESATIIDLNYTSVAINKTEEGFVLDLLGEGAQPKLSFHVKSGEGRWWVDQLFYGTDEYYLNTYIGTHVGFSYACTPTSRFLSKEPAVEPNKFHEIQITRLQLEFRFTTDNTEPFVGYSEAWDCVGFISPGILGGLFVVILLLVILAAGLSWIMEIRTMDRFDDPKGKTITINVNE
ncbi:V-type proton ATPase subunit S1 [Sergentomyia squamirostris]